MNRPPFASSFSASSVSTGQGAIPVGPAPTLANLPTYTQVLSAPIQPAPPLIKAATQRATAPMPIPVTPSAAALNNMQDPFAFLGPTQPLTNDLFGHDVAASYQPIITRKSLSAPWRTGIIATGCAGLILAVLLQAAFAGLFYPSVIPVSNDLQAFKSSLLSSGAQAFLATEHAVESRAPLPAYRPAKLNTVPARPAGITFKVGTGITIDNKRLDPLAPLVQAVKPAPLTPEESIKADPVLGMNFVGLVQGNGRQADVAMVEVIDAATQETKTLVKPVGELFYTNGSAVQIKRASQGLLEVTVDGAMRRLPLTLGQAEGGGARKAPGDGLDKLSE